MNKGQILIVDDEAELLKLLTQSISMTGYRVLTALSGNAAYRILEDNAAAKKDLIQVVVSDWKMPDGNGLELLRRLRSGPHQDTPFVLISGAVSREDLDAALIFDADAVLLKPFTQEGIIEQIDVAIDRRRKKQVRKALSLG